MKRLLFILFSVWTLNAFSQANQQVTYWTSPTGQAGSSSFRFLAPGGGNVASLALGPLATFGNVFQMADSVNAAYAISTWNHSGGAGAFTGLIATNNLSHSADAIITSGGYTGASDVAEYISDARGGYQLNSLYTPITFLSVGGVIPVKVTTTQMNAITGAVDGQEIYNTTTHDTWWYKNGTWTEETSVGAGTENLDNVLGVGNTSTKSATVGDITAGHFIGNTGVPTTALGPGGVTSITMGSHSNDAHMFVTLVVPAAGASGTLGTITFTRVYGTSPFVVWSVADATTAINIRNTTNGYFIANESATGQIIMAGTLNQGTYNFNILVGQ